MGRTLYLHIGMGRAGSSALQLFCEARRDVLRARGLDYPSAAEIGFPGQAGGNAQGIARASEPAVPVIGGLVGYLRAAPFDRILLSSEFLFAWPVGEFEAVRDALQADGVRLVILALVREQREWLISRYAQGVKTRRWSDPLQRFLERRYRRDMTDYHRRFGELAACVGHDNLVVRLFERERLRNGDARSEILALTGTDVTDLLDADTETNASASVIEIEALRRINARPADEVPRGRVFLRRARAWCEKMGWQPANDFFRLVEPGLMREIKAHYADSNGAFRDAFFPAIGGELFASSIPDDYEMVIGDDLMERRVTALIEACGGR